MSFTVYFATWYTSLKSSDDIDRTDPTHSSTQLVTTLTYIAFNFNFAPISISHMYHNCIVSIRHWIVSGPVEISMTVCTSKHLDLLCNSIWAADNYSLIYTDYIFLLRIGYISIRCWCYWAMVQVKPLICQPAPRDHVICHSSVEPVEPELMISAEYKRTRIC